MFKVDSIPGKGRGLVSTQSIARGTEILSEAPFIVFPCNSSTELIVDRLSIKSKDDQRRFLELMNCHQDLPPLIGIVKTNALPCGDNDSFTGKSADAGGIFLHGSLFNSSCVPNTNNCWDEQKQSIVFRALRDIAAGEELCISYGNLIETRDVRRRELGEKFGFECHCAACSLSGEDLRLSDQRRETLKGLYNEIAQCANMPSVGVTKVCELVYLLNVVDSTWLP